MEKIKGYNRNIIGGRRPHKGVQKYGKYQTLTERMMAEMTSFEEYVKRTQSPRKC